jgi:hypothetical protein
VHRCEKGFKERITKKNKNIFLGYTEGIVDLVVTIAVL